MSAFADNFCTFGLQKVERVPRSILFFYIIKINPAWIQNFLVKRANSYVDYSSINKLLILSGRGQKVDFWDAERLLTKC